MYIFFCKHMQKNIYSQICIQQSLWGQRKNDLIRQMAAYSRSADAHSGSICRRADMHTIIQEELISTYVISAYPSSLKVEFYFHAGVVYSIP